MKVKKVVRIQEEEKKVENSVLDGSDDDTGHGNNMMKMESIHGDAVRQHILLLEIIFLDRKLNWNAYSILFCDVFRLQSEEQLPNCYFLQASVT